MISFGKAFFIKLGRKGLWERECIEGGTIRLGFRNPFHEDCLRRDYEPARKYFESQASAKSVATRNVNQIVAFYEASHDTVWITFYKRRMWWGFAAPGIQQIDDGSRVRNIVGGWTDRDANGNELSVDKISGKLTKVQMYQGTICDVRESNYLSEKLNGFVSKDVSQAKESLSNLEKAILPIIKSLTWHDFELFVDLLLTNAGWKRISERGGHEKDIDLDVLMPVSKRRAFVQVKSSSSQAEFDEYWDTFKDNSLYDEMFYVVHSPTSMIKVPDDIRSVTILDDEASSKLAIEAGMVSWLIEKAS